MAEVSKFPDHRIDGSVRLRVLVRLTSKIDASHGAKQIENETPRTV